MFGTTAEVVEIGRERFGYWCFELLFLMCSDVEQGSFGFCLRWLCCADAARADHEPERRRIATLCLPFLLNRCAAVIKTYVADAPLRGKMPFPRCVPSLPAPPISLTSRTLSVRQEELIFVLQKLLTCRLREGTLWASTQPEPSLSVLAATPLDTSLPLPQLIRSALLRSPFAHLYELHPLFTSLLALSTSSPSITSAYIPYRRIAGTGEQEAGLKGLPAGFVVTRIGKGKVEEQESDVVQLTLACLRKVGEEIGAGL